MKFLPDYLLNLIFPPTSSCQACWCTFEFETSSPALFAADRWTPLCASCHVGVSLGRCAPTGRCLAAETPPIAYLRLELKLKLKLKTLAINSAWCCLPVKYGCGLQCASNKWGLNWGGLLATGLAMDGECPGPPPRYDCNPKRLGCVTWIRFSENEIMRF